MGHSFSTIKTNNCFLFGIGTKQENTLCSLGTKGMFIQNYLCNHLRSTGDMSGADPGFFLGWGALVSCSTSTPINHIVFLFCFFAEYQLYKKTAGHLREGAQPLHPPPRSAPVCLCSRLQSKPDFSLVSIQIIICKWSRKAKAESYTTCEG